MQDPQIYIAHLGLGSNLGDRRVQIEEALRGLTAPDLQVRQVSSLYESAPQGPVLDQPPFYNAVVQVETVLEPGPLLGRCLQLEQILGRRRNVLKGPRVIDIDLLLMEEVVSREPELTVPHPELTHRAFALVPLLELTPMALDPRDGVLLCLRAAHLLRSQALVRLGSLPAFPARTRLPVQHGSPSTSSPHLPIC